jgi:hypothetical protein
LLIVQCYTNHDCFAAKLNQQNISTIKSLNLCIEIIRCSSPKSLCNLAEREHPPTMDRAKSQQLFTQIQHIMMVWA